MSNMYGFAQQDNVARASDGTSVGLRATRDGALIQVPWLQALCLEGRVFGTFNGAADLDATGVGTFGAGGISTGEFDWHLVVPNTVAVLPVMLAVTFSAVGTILTYGLFGAWGTDSVVAANGISLTEYNYRPGSSNTSACTAVALSDTGGSALTEEGFFFGTQKLGVTSTATHAEPTTPSYTVDTVGFVPVIEGARQVVGWTPGQAGTGTIQSAWVELPISAVN